MATSYILALFDLDLGSPLASKTAAGVAQLAFRVRIIALGDARFARARQSSLDVIE
jgi:hypothetical protein